MTVVRPIDPSELTAWVGAMQVPFFIDRAPEEDAAYRADRLDYSRALGAFDGDRVVGTFRSFDTSLSVPGGASLAADAITNVTVLPTHRRQGLLNRMMAADLRAAVDRGDPVGILIASEYPIYGRYGFGPATESAGYAVNRAAARFRVPGEGSLELVPPAALRPIVEPVFERFRAGQPGAIARNDKYWDAYCGLIKAPWAPKAGARAVLCRDSRGEPQGWLRYQVEDSWADGLSTARLTVLELVAATPDAYARLWRFTTEVDLVTIIRADERSTAELLPWLLEDARAVRQTTRSEFLWLRILDVAATLTSRSYLAAVECVLEVRDEAGYASGRYRLEASPEGAVCRPTTDPADLSLTVQALGSAYLGGTSFLTLARAGLVEEAAPGALARADALFRTAIVPWCNTEF